MSTVRKEYLCQVTIIEGRDLISPESSGSCDPFVKVTCGNAGSQATTCEEATTNPCWNQSFTFSKLFLTNVELESWELKIECYGYSPFLANKLIGAFSIGLATLHRSSSHEIYNMWINLIHPDFGSSPRGYLLLNCFIIGPDDVPPTHLIGDHLVVEEDKEDSDEEEIEELMSHNQRMQKRQKESQIKVLGGPLVVKKSYQLSINIYKAENLPKLKGHPSPFVSVRSMGIVEKTHTCESTPSPIWNVKLSFPAFKPILNDRINIRVWDHKNLQRDLLVANIPEIPSDHDFFNINNLLSRGGIMPCRWVNLYGPNPDEESIWKDIKYLSGFVKRSYLGSCFLGRMLISMTITPNDTPETGPSRASPYREPISKLHIFRSILYELKNVRGLGNSIRIRVSIGNYHVFSRKAIKRETTDSDTGEALEYFQWGDHYSGEAVDNIKEIFPIDPTQVPDVILDLYSEYYLGGEARIGYIRKPISEMMENDHPKWIPFKSINTHSEIGSDSPGLLLASLAYFPDEEMKNRTQISKPRKADKWLCWNIYGGFDIAPSLSDEEINLQLKIYCGDIVLSLPDNIASENIGTKYPIWKWSGVKQIQLHEDLHFEQNLRVELHNKIKALKLYWTTLEIGQFSVPLHRCENLWSQPHFFHIINASEIGASQGRLLADFYISKTYVEPDNNPCVRNNSTILCDIDFALIGIRNLVPHYENPSIFISIPGYKMGNGEKAEIQIGHMKNNDKGNPNFLSILHFPNIELPVEPIYLPAIYVKIKDNAFLSWNECYTYIPLIPYAQWIKDEVKKQEAQDLYTRNFTTKDLIEQAPLRSLTLKKIRRTEQFSYTDYGETSEISIISNEANKPKASIDMICDIYEPKNSKVQQKIQFDKLEEDEEAELEQRENEISEIEAELVDLRARAKSAEWKKGNIDEKLKKEIRYLEKTLDTLNEGTMTELKFLKSDEKIGEDDFQYNRPVHKGGLYEEALDLPYQRYLLFTKTKNTEKLSAYKVGEPNGAVLKACIKLKPCEKTQKEEYPEVQEMNWDFDFFHPIFQRSGYLMKIFEYSSFVVRLYLLRGLSLSAVSNAPDWTAFAGGLEALSSADSYPEILIGEDKNQVMKYICDNRPETQTLNPDYFRTYELKADFPSDWKLEINIWNLTEYRFDSLIGTTAIDLEDRYYGEKKNQNKLMVQIVKEFIDMEINNTQDAKYRDWLSFAKKLVKKHETYLENNKTIAPVEYRTLHHKGKSTAQGMLELFLELYDSSEAKLVPLANISKPCPEEYELRLILWKCEGIPKENDTIDIYFQAHFDPTGWLEESITKETDCHVGSEDGKGVFNWRMKFHFQLPCSFARLRLVAYEFNTFGDDRVISEVVLDLTQYFKRVIKEGKLKVDEEWVELHLPNLPGTNGGKTAISFDILSLAEANQRPVGEGQNEPNRDPELEKPEIGRGVSDYIKGTALDVFSWPLLNMSIIKKILTGISIGGMLIVLFIYPGYLTGGR